MRDAAHEAVKAAPPVSVGGLTLAGVALQEWVFILTIIYTLLLIFDKFFPGILARVGRWCWALVMEVLHGKGH